MNRKTSRSTLSGQKTQSQLSKKSEQSNINQETKSECENFTLQKYITISRLSVETGVSTYSGLSEYDLDTLPESVISSQIDYQIQPKNAKLKKSQNEKCCSIQ